jgi:hypothetical protein
MFVVHKPWSHVAKMAKSRKPRWTGDRKKLAAISLRQQRKTAKLIVAGVKKIRDSLPSTIQIGLDLEEGYPTFINRMRLAGGNHEKFDEAGESLWETLILSSGVAIDNLPDGIKSRYRFDYSNPRIERVWRKRAGEKIVEPILQGTRDSIQNAIHNQFIKGLSPRDIAEDIKGYVGLYPRLATALKNYKVGLAEKGLPIENQVKYALAYEDKLLDYRAMSIARTETNFMINRGQLEVWRQGQDNGIIPKGATKVWEVDGNPCPDCDDMDGEAVGLNDVWVMGDGTICEVPQDSHPQCECTMSIEYGDIETADFGEEEDGEEQGE